MTDAYISFDGDGGAEGFLGCHLFSCDRESEQLDCTSPDDAIERSLDAYDDQLAGTLTVYGYRRMVLSPRDVDPDRILERVLEDLDEEFGNPDEYTERTPALLAAADAFAAAVRAEYQVWRCDTNHSAVVDVAKWVAEHAPHWLTPGEE